MQSEALKHSNKTPDPNKCKHNFELEEHSKTRFKCSICGALAHLRSGDLKLFRCAHTSTIGGSRRSACDAISTHRRSSSATFCDKHVPRYVSTEEQEIRRVIEERAAFSERVASEADIELAKATAAILEEPCASEVECDSWGAPWPPSVF